jgi:hypothetical protein
MQLQELCHLIEDESDLAPPPTTLSREAKKKKS